MPTLRWCIQGDCVCSLVCVQPWYSAQKCGGHCFAGCRASVCVVWPRGQRGVRAAQGAVWVSMWGAGATIVLLQLVIAERGGGAINGEVVLELGGGCEGRQACGSATGRKGVTPTGMDVACSAAL